MFNAGARSGSAGLLAAVALTGVAAGVAVAQLPVPGVGTIVQTATQTAGTLPVVGGVVSGTTGAVGGIVSGVPPAVTGAVDHAVAGALGGALPTGPGGAGGAGGSAGQLPPATIDNLLQVVLAGNGVAGDGAAVVVDNVAPTARVKVLSRLTQIARTGSLRLLVSSDEAGVVAVGGGVRPGKALKGRSRGHSRAAVKWPNTVLGFRTPGKLQLTIKLGRKARISLGRSQNARVTVATVAADVRHNQRSDYLTLQVKR
jgi:hypothetical protein